MAEPAQHPPCPRGEGPGVGVVDDHLGARADAQPSEGRGRGGRIGQRMAPGAAGLRARQVVVEAHVAGAGDVALAVLGRSLGRRGQIEAGVEHDPRRVARGGRGAWPDQRASCAWASGPRSVTASWWRKRPTSVTTPMVCGRSAVAQLGDDRRVDVHRHHLDPRWHHVADADAVQHRAQHDDGADVGQRLGVVVLGQRQVHHRLGQRAVVADRTGQHVGDAVHVQVRA